MSRGPGSGALRLAHRGDWRHAPENTIPALMAALEVATCDGLEFDVRLSADGVPVLLHDLSLMRVQGVAAIVGSLAADELATFGVPRLDDALAAIDARRPGVFLDVELKATDHGAATADVLRAFRGEAPTDAVVSSFEDASLASMAAALPGWRRWLNADDLSATTIERARRLACGGVSVQFRALDDVVVEVAGQAGLDVVAWTIRRREDADRVDALGVVAMCVEDEALEI